MFQLTIVLAVSLTLIASRADAVICALLSAQSCSLGTFRLRDLQSSALGGDCSCVPCLPGSFRNVSTMDVCEACGDYGSICSSTSGKRQNRSPGSCSLFNWSNTVASLNALFKSYSDDAAEVTIGTRTVKVSTYYDKLLSTYLWGDMGDFRNLEMPCGQLRFQNGLTNITLIATGAKSGTGSVRFNLTNTGSLPVNFTYSGYSNFAGIFSQSFGLVQTVQVVGTGSTSTYQIGFDSSQVPSGLEYANKSGYSVTFPISVWQYWEQAIPRSFEQTMYLTLNVNYVGSSLFASPTVVNFVLRSGEVGSVRVQLLNLSPTPATYTMSLEYDGANQFLSTIPGGSLNGSGQCVSNTPQLVPLNEYSTSIEFTASAVGLLVGEYGAFARISASDSTAAIRITLVVTPGIVDQSNYVVNFDPPLSSTNISVDTLVEFLVVPRDYLSQQSFDFGGVSPTQLSFTSNILPLFPCSNCNDTIKAVYIPLTGFYFTYEFERPGLHTIKVLDTYGDLVQGTPANITVQPLNCAVGDPLAVFSDTLGECICQNGYGVTFYDDPFVLCRDCVPGEFSDLSTGLCAKCPAGKFSASSKAVECSSCASLDNLIMTVPSSPLKPIVLGDSIELELDPQDIIPNTNQDGCDRCPLNSKARSDLGICVPCAADMKIRKVVNSILFSNDTHATVSWGYDCVCKATHFKNDEGTCTACPTGAFCLGKDKSTILPLEGFWKSPWTAPEAPLEKCRQASSCPGVFLDPAVSQQSDEYYALRELAYLAQRNTSLALVQQQQGNCGLDDLCDIGFAGPLCRKCAIGFTPVGSTGCTTCIPQGAMIFVIIAGISVALLLTAFIVNRTIKVASEEMQYIGQSMKQMSKSPSFLVPAFEASGGSTRQITAESSNAGVETVDTYNKTRGSAAEVVMAKILISHLQEVSMSVSFQLAWPVWLAQMFDVFNIVSSAGQTLFSLSCLLDPTRATSGDSSGEAGVCLNSTSVDNSGLYDARRPQTFFIEAIFFAVIPFGWACIAGSFWYFWHWRSRILYQRKRGRSTWNFFLLTLIVLIFLLYPTLSRTALKFYSCSSDVSGYRFLEADFNVVCLGKTHITWMATLGTFMLVCYAIGIPVVIFIVLYRHHTKLSKYKPVFGFVFLGFIPRFYYWECVIMTRKLLFSICAVILGPAGADIQALVGLGIILTFLQLQTVFWPYDAPLLNRCETAGLLVRFLTLLFGLGLDSKNVSGSAKSAFGTLIVLLNSAFLIFAVFSIVRAAHAIKRDGFLVAFGLASGKTDSKVNEEDGANQGAGKVKSAVPQMHHVYGDNGENDNIVFASERQLSIDTMESSSANPIFVAEKGTPLHV